MRARFLQKLIFYRLIRPKLTYLCRISRAFQCCICMSTYRVAHRCCFPPNEYFSAFLKKNNWKVSFKRIFILTCINWVNTIVWCKKFGDAIQTPLLPLYQVPPRRCFHVFCQKKCKKRQCKISLETYFRTAENAVVLCKNFDTEGKIHFVVALAVSLATSEGSDIWSVEGNIILNAVA